MSTSMDSTENKFINYNLYWDGFFIKYGFQKGSLKIKKKIHTTRKDIKKTKIYVKTLKNVQDINSNSFKLQISKIMFKNIQNHGLTDY